MGVVKVGGFWHLPRASTPQLEHFSCAHAAESDFFPIFLTLAGSRHFAIRDSARGRGLISTRFLTPYRQLVMFRKAIKDALKSGQSSGLDRNFSCWGACHKFAWSANTNKVQENRLTETFIKASFRICQKLTRCRYMGLKTR